MDLLGTSFSLNSFQHPFQQDKVNRINIFMIKGLFDSKIIWNSSIEFKNQDIEGTKNFKGDTLDEVLAQMQTFLKSLK